MSLNTSPELFINMKHIPDEDSSEYNAFFENELHKIEYGVTINGVYIPGWLYWHTNHWYIHQDEPDKFNKVIKRKLDHPQFRDNEWIIALHREEAIKQQKGLFLIGSRRLGKSELEASVIGRSAVIYQGSENVVSGGNSSDIKLIADKLDKGLNNIHPYFRFPRIEDNWRSQVTLGFKERSGRKYPWSYILIRNYEDGVNTEAAAGITAKEFIIDEVGKFAFLRCLEAAIPAFTSEYGWRCSPLLVGTGGSFDKGSDAQKVFYEPEAYNMLSVEVKDEPRKYGLFIPGKYRMEGKVDTTFGSFIERNNDIRLPADSELFLVPFKEADEAKASAIIEHERDQARKASDMDTLLKTTMYYPKTPQECFLTSSANFYDGELAMAQKNRLIGMRITGTPVILKHDGENIVHEFTDMKPIADFPAKKGVIHDAPIMIWEHPISQPPFGLYVAGVDPYRHSQSSSSDSLGAVYIFKRMHDIQSETYQDMFVACYVARPKTKEEWNENARLLIKYYNARTLCENDEMGFIEYMKAKGDASYLERQPSWLKEIAPNSTVQREFGIHRASERVRNHLRSCLKMYMEETILTERDESGSVIKEVKGVNRILDPVLLEELAKWNDDDNFDREVAASLAIALARHLDPILGRVSDQQDDRFKSYYKHKQSTSTQMWKTGSGVFKGGKKRLFH